MNRRLFSSTLLSPLLLNSQPPRLDLSAIPNFCSHEHWGSVASIGPLPGGYRADFERGAVPTRATGLVDLVADPYLRGWMTAGGDKVDTTSTGWAAWNQMRPALRRHRLTGVFQSLRRGILQQYGADIDRLHQAAFEKLETAIAANYRDYPGWYRRAMKKAAFSELIRPVQPEFYFQTDNAAAAAEEARFTRTVLRIDPLLPLWRRDNPRRRVLAEWLGIDPGDARGWRAFLAALFERAAAGGAVGIKQLQAYRRPLDFRVREDSAVRWTGELNEDEERVFQDWMVHECCRLAHERNWPHQVHVGTNNIGESSPLPLAALARRYPNMKLVMIHCWPFLKESGWLAKFLPNIYIDTCWMPVLNPAFLEEALTMWWNYVPLHKVMCGHDSTSVEMASGSGLFTREIIAATLSEQSRKAGIPEREQMQIATKLLQNNAVAVFRYGRKYS